MDLSVLDLPAIRHVPGPSATGSTALVAPTILLSPPYRCYGGLQWAAALPNGFSGASDSGDAPNQSLLRLCEDDREIGPAHTQHADIAQLGRGRYSHWDGALRFSTSDGSDPNTNGRCYAIFKGKPPLRLLSLGSCHLYGAVADLDDRRMVRAVWRRPELCNSPRDLLQLIDICTGRLEVEAPLRAFTASPQHGPGGLPAAVRDAEAVVLELGSSVDVGYGAYVLSRKAIKERLVNPIAALGVAERRVVKRWLHLGIFKREEAVRSACVPRLLELIAEAEMEDRALAADIVRRARGARQTAEEVVSTIRQIFARLGRTADLIVSSNNAFTPDGRALSWPINFSRDLEPICRELRVPLLHPSRMVAERGTAFAMMPDLHHFTPQFLRVLGETILATVQSAASRRVEDACHLLA